MLEKVIFLTLFSFINTPTRMLHAVKGLALNGNETVNTDPSVLLNIHYVPVLPHNYNSPSTKQSKFLLHLF